MRIRAENTGAFQSEAERSFENRMVLHLNKHFPDHCAELGDAGVRGAIALGIERAGEYKIVTERDVCKYITLMFAFGERFDDDANLPWAAGILNSKVYSNGTDRTEALYRRAKRHARDANGGRVV